MGRRVCVGFLRKFSFSSEGTENEEGTKVTLILISLLMNSRRDNLCKILSILKKISKEQTKWALSIFCIFGNLSCFQYFIEDITLDQQEISLDMECPFKDEDYFSHVQPIWISSFYGHLPLVKYLVSRGCRIRISNQDGDTPLFVACENGGHIDLVRYLLLQNSEVNYQNKDRYFPLLIGSANGHLEIIDILLQMEQMLIKLEFKKILHFWRLAITDS